MFEIEIDVKAIGRIAVEVKTRCIHHYKMSNNSGQMREYGQSGEEGRNH